MRINRKPIFLILICAVALFCGCSASETRVYPPFFKITDPESGGTAYLLGTMHVGAANTVYPDEIYRALDESDVLAVEVDLIALDADRDRLLNAMKLLECQGETARQFMGGDYNEIKDFFKSHHIYTGAFDHYIPALWSAQLSSKIASDCGYESRYGTDRAMLYYAKKNDIQIVELESAEEQYKMNAAEPRELQVYSLLESARTDYDEQKRQLQALYTAWSTHDLSTIEQMLSESVVPESLAEQYAEYYDAMYTDRQRKMADYISSALESGGTVFVAVGAMHCCAEPDILDFLSEKNLEILDIS